MPDETRSLDLGGGPNWDRHWSEQDAWTAQTMEGLHFVQMAKKFPQKHFFIFDIGIPPEGAKKLQKELPNLRFFIGIITPHDSLPFREESFDSVEMNFMYTPFGIEDEQYKRFDDLGRPVVTYLHALTEAARILKPKGTLVIRERRKNVNAIRRLLSRDGDLILEGVTLYWIKSAEVADPHLSRFTQQAFYGVKKSESSGDTESAYQNTPFQIEFEKGLR